MTDVWTHALCDECWHGAEGPRQPHRLSSIGPSERCCGCGAETLSGIFRRADPSSHGHCRHSLEVSISHVRDGVEMNLIGVDFWIPADPDAAAERGQERRMRITSAEVDDQLVGVTDVRVTVGPTPVVGLHPFGPMTHADGYLLQTSSLVMAWQIDGIDDGTVIFPSRLDVSGDLSGRVKYLGLETLR